MEALGRILRRSRGFLMIVGKIEMVLAVTLLGLIVVCIGTQVFTRYVFNYPIIWVEEISTYAFIWGVFIGASAGLKYDRHISIQWLSQKVSPSSRHYLAIFGYVVTLALVVIVAPAAWTVVGIESRSMTTALPILLPRSLFYSVPFLVGVVSLGVTALHLIFAHIHALATKQEVEPILLFVSDADEFDEVEKVLSEGTS